MISKKVFNANGTNARFLSDFIIASEQFTRVYVYIYDDTLNPNGAEDVLQNTGLPWSYPDNVYRRGANAPIGSLDLITLDKWSLVTNSILFYDVPQATSKVWIEVGTTAEEFGSTLLISTVEQAEAAVAEAQLGYWEAEAEQLTAKSYAREPEDSYVNDYISNGDGTFQLEGTADFSALHWANHSEASAQISEGNLSGALVPIMATLAGSHTIPASGVVDARGYMYCDGSVIPGGYTVSGTLPNLTDGRFLSGATTAGAVGGSNTFTLTTANMPAHTHTADHNHTASSASAGIHTHAILGSNTGGIVGAFGDTATGSSGSSNAGATESAGAHSHTITVDSASVTTSSAGSGTTVTHIPQYMNVVYLLKVM